MTRAEVPKRVIYDSLRALGGGATSRNTPSARPSRHRHNLGFIQGPKIASSAEEKPDLRRGRGKRKKKKKKASHQPQFTQQKFPLTPHHSHRFLLHILTPRTPIKVRSPPPYQIHHFLQHIWRGRRQFRMSVLMQPTEGFDGG